MHACPRLTFPSFHLYSPTHLLPFKNRPLVAQITIGSLFFFLLGLIYLPPKVKHRWEVKFMVAQGWTLRQW